MDAHNSLGLDFVSQTEQISPTDIRFWTWSELLVALKECQDSFSSMNTSFIAQRFIDCLVEKLLPGTSNTDASSSDAHSFHEFSSDTKSSTSSRNKYSRTPWWFKDLVFLNTKFVEKLVRTMISRDLDHGVVSKFLFYYHRKSKFLYAKPAEKCKVAEVVISLLCLLDGQSIPFKGLFDIYQVASMVKVNKKYRNMLDSLIGSQLDQATLDYLLVPSPRGKNYIYDVNMVLKLVKSFLLIIDRCHLPAARLNKVGRLMDLYLSEIALDSHMKHSKFSALVMTLPDSARESHDGLYRAMDLYFEVHTELCEEAKISLCYALNYEKLSTEALKHLAKNSKFPSRISAKAFMAQSSKLTRLIKEIYHCKSFSDHSWFCDTSKEINSTNEDDEKLRANLQELMHWNEVELKKDCPTRRSVMAYTRRSRMSASGHGRYLPKLCGC